MRYKVYCYMVLIDFYVFFLVNCPEDRLLQFLSGHIAGMDYPSFRMSRLFSKVKLRMPSLQFFRKPDPELNQFADPFGPVLYNQADNLRPAESRPGFNRVFYVGIKGILFAHHGGDASLRVECGRFFLIPLFFFGNGSASGRLEREGKPGNAASYHKKIRFYLHSIKGMTSGLFCQVAGTQLNFDDMCDV